jgi:hypothetical protein
MLELKERIRSAETNALIQYVAIYRAMKLNKEMAILCMEELDRRRQNGEDIDLKSGDDVANILRSVGKGFVARIATSDQVQDVLKELKEKKIPAAKISNNLIHLGIINQEQKKQVTDIVGVLEIEQDGNILENVVCPKVSEVWKNSKGFGD